MRPGSWPLWNLATAIARLHEQLEGDAEPPLDTIRTREATVLNGGRDAVHTHSGDAIGLGKDGNALHPPRPVRGAVPLRPGDRPRGGRSLVEMLRGFDAPEDSDGPQGVYVDPHHALGSSGRLRPISKASPSWSTRTQYLLPRMHDDAAAAAQSGEPARLFGGEVAAGPGASASSTRARGEIGRLAARPALP